MAARVPHVVTSAGFYFGRAGFFTLDRSRALRFATREAAQAWVAKHGPAYRAATDGHLELTVEPAIVAGSKGGRS